MPRKCKSKLYSRKGRDARGRRLEQEVSHGDNTLSSIDHTQLAIQTPDRNMQGLQRSKAMGATRPEDRSDNSVSITPIESHERGKRPADLAEPSVQNTVKRNRKSAASVNDLGNLIGGINLECGVTVGGIELIPQQQVVHIQDAPALETMMTIVPSTGFFMVEEQHSMMDFNTFQTIIPVAPQQQIIVDFHNYKQICGVSPPDVVVDFNNYKQVLGLSPPPVIVDYGNCKEITGITPPSLDTIAQVEPAEPVVQAESAATIEVPTAEIQEPVIVEEVPVEEPENPWPTTDITDEQMQLVCDMIDGANVSDDIDIDL